MSHAACAHLVRTTVIKEQQQVKYIVDATPDSAHMEQTSFILRYVSCNDRICSIQERFVEFLDCNRKTGAEIAQLILDFCSKHGILIDNCRGQGYDNGSNMAGMYNGAKANILAINPFALFSPCACHSLNLCGSHAAECCPDVQKFFGVV